MGLAIFPKLNTALLVNYVAALHGKQSMHNQLWLLLNIRFFLGWVGVDPITLKVRCVIPLFDLPYSILQKNVEIILVVEEHTLMAKVWQYLIWDHFALHMKFYTIICISFLMEGNPLIVSIPS